MVCTFYFMHVELLKYACGIVKLHLRIINKECKYYFLMHVETYNKQGVQIFFFLRMWNC